MNFHKNTVSDALLRILSKLMAFDELKSFRLVGGTSLSLLLGHRVSIDIDLFTDVVYGSINFERLDNLFLNSFEKVEMGYGGNKSIGKSYYIGDVDETIKVDLFYTEPFVFPIIEFEGLRLSQLEEITAMKLEVIGNNGRKKDFWDLHELLEHFSLKQMINFYVKKYPYGHSKDELIKKLTDFTEADTDFDPICLRNKYWELVKLDIEETVKDELY
ncbi:nucleotidyl transferase AbiEii/AbiGii toxin family protein [Aquimarina sp. U1-2]|uniref:nucleotidyl transferase AbiEii/AbiGii toxin family protein n=1 Tax=Aquimarina sp. U1-2 TaxID=2823141 RepID=UPI001AED0B27|nr:nucleotidyl transferase AbiEii/AbiGii toxin family protein [Aquimarina sp. U1-2]MBP2833861.1 nucleotidyl transferase AbiEii/AbiGii toxin family protein [Aquimarina sp. U1-2]